MGKTNPARSNYHEPNMSPIRATAVIVAAVVVIDLLFVAGVVVSRRLGASADDPKAPVIAAVFVAHTAVLSFLIFHTLRGHRRRTLKLAGRCPHCGYDLRSSTDRCPECGNAITCSQ